jgi:hypothetical protein
VKGRGRSLGAAACFVATALLLVGSLRHRELRPLDAPGGTDLVDAAVGEHTPAAHVEAAIAIDPAHCPACLLQLKSLGDAAPPPRTPAALVRLALVLKATDAAIGSAPLRLAAPRAPPLA